MRTSAIFLLYLLALVCLLCGCKQVQYVPVETVRLDSIYLTQTLRDSIVRYDSVYVRDKGDTLYVELEVPVPGQGACGHDGVRPCGHAGRALSGGEEADALGAGEDGGGRCGDRRFFPTAGGDCGLYRVPFPTEMIIFAA